jgi:hypothetical protein
MLEAILEFLGEFLLQVAIQLLVDLGFHVVVEPFRKTPNPLVAAVGHFVLGALAGALSLWLVPAHLVPVAWRAANLAFTPLAVGFMMLIIGSLRSKQGLSVLRIERFVYGYLFALGVAIARFYFTR